MSALERASGTRGDQKFPQLFPLPFPQNSLEVPPQPGAGTTGQPVSGK